MVDVFTVALAIVILVAVAWRIRPVRPTTTMILVLLTGAWIWANLRTSGWEEFSGGDALEGLNPVTKAMFWRGWPLAPCMFCIVHGNRFRPDGLEGWVLAFNWLVLFAGLSLAKSVCGRCSRWRDGRKRAAETLSRRESFQED